MELPALMPACSPGILPRGVGELPFLSFIGQFHSVLSKDMEELCHLGLTAFFQPGVVIIWYILRSHTLFYLNLLNITAATYWETMRCTTCGRCFQPFLYSLQSMHHSVSFSSVQSLSRVRLFATPWITARQASLSITNSRSSLKLMSIESVMPSSHLLLCRPLLLLPPIPPSLRVFPMSQLFAWGGQCTGVSASASVLPKKSQDWSPLERTGWISYASLPPFKKQNSKESVYPKTWQVVKSTFIWFTAAVWLQKPCPWHPIVLPTVVPYLCALSCIILWQNLTDPILFYALPCFKRTGDPLCKYMDQISIF